MATAITKKLRKDLEHAVHVLLGRAKPAFPFPLDGTQRIKFWNNTFSPAIVRAHDTLASEGYDVSGLNWYNAFFTTDAAICRSTVALSNESSRVFLHRPQNDADTYLSLHTIERAMEEWPGKFDEFRSWLEHVSIISRDTQTAINTLDELLDFCGTAGQLKRAVPDLLMYLSKPLQKELAEQTRASNMPHEWASFDRSRIDTLQMCLAKAHLFPEGDRERYQEIDVTWAKYA